MQPLIRTRVRVTGVVQGVGFRPHVYGLAHRHGLAGFVENDTQGVLLEIEGTPDALASFLADLRHNPPPLATIDALESTAIEPHHTLGFSIHESHSLAGESTPVPPDIATCPDCLAELFDPTNRRYRYPFLNCTNCGPRFTIIRDLPYDRPSTTMADFRMCPACEREYHDPLDRRFHAQPTACPDCGPHLTFHPTGETREGALQAARRLLDAGGIVAIKGIGGFHLACDAANDHAIGELRRRKNRVGKPLAVMARDLATIRLYAKVTAEEAHILESRERPIVLLDRRPDGAKLSELVAPGQAQLGFFLPYSPLHHLLLEAGKPLVMTSGNRSEEPIARENEEALERLKTLADGFLLHDRDIHVVCDDSVVRAHVYERSTSGAGLRPAAGLQAGLSIKGAGARHNHENAIVPIRRSRGYAPLPVRLPFTGPSILAVGGELKATFCLTKGPRAYLSQHIGDMENLETMRAFERALDQMRRLFRVDPEAVACDLHPAYLSTRWARQFAESNRIPLIQVQHHHAHAASLMAEHGLPPDARIIAVSFDGTGYGTDGAIWGGEFLLSTYESSERLGHIKYVRLPGGDAAIRKPYRTALAHLQAAGIDWTDDLPCVRACPEPERRILARQLNQGVNSPYTSSAGRLFDAAASILGIRHEVSYEAQGAMEMEALAAAAAAAAAAPSTTSGAGLLARGPASRPGLPIVDPTPWLQELIWGLRQGTRNPVLAAQFHATVAQAIAQTCATASQQTGVRTIGLTGGVFQNVLLLKLTRQALKEQGFLEVLTHRIVPPNDGGLALGQAVAAAAASKLKRKTS